IAERGAQASRDARVGAPPLRVAPPDRVEKCAFRHAVDPPRRVYSMGAGSHGASVGRRAADNRDMSPISSAPPRPVPPRGPFRTWREVLAVSAFSFVLAIAVQLADGDARQIVNRVALLFLPMTVGFFVGRALWRWWRSQPYGTARTGANLALVVSLVSWANVA